MGLPTAWLFDIDGTLAIHNNRNPYDWREAHADHPNPPIVTMTQALATHSGVSAILAISGREEKARGITSEWLTRHGVPYDELFMRADGDYRADDVVKAEILESLILPRYAIAAVVDDRNRVVEMWRRLGFVCLQVSAGDF